VDAHVSELVHCANRRKPPIENHARADPIDDAAGRRRCASHRECHGVIAGFARLQMHGVIVVVTLYGPIVFVCSEPVVVLGMIVVAVEVKVQQERLAGGRGQDQSEQDRYCARHNTSVCNQGGIIKRPSVPAAGRTVSRLRSSSAECAFGSASWGVSGTPIWHATIAVVSWRFSGDLSARWRHSSDCPRRAGTAGERTLPESREVAGNRAAGSGQ
jgi:hypothetical protein